VGVSRGYLGRPGLTAERFIPDPFGGRPGARLYRSGDLGRVRPDGAVEFLGRADRQVKLRGFRVELEEIERALERHPGVRQAVTAVYGEPGDQRLVAWIVRNGEGGTDASALKRDLRGCLPEYMVPAAFVFLAALPLTANGKVDLRALPAPETAAAPTAGAPSEPRTPAEEILAGVWAELLQVERVTVEDNFFDLGGHSLLAMQLNSRIGRLFGAELPLGAVFEARSLGDLARRVEAALLPGRSGEAPPLRASSAGGDAPLSFAQERHWILQQLDPESPLYNIRGVLRAEGELRLDVLAAAFREILRRHQVLRTSFPVVAGRPVQRIEPVPRLDLPLVDLRRVGWV
jgi:acyl carrier protein